MNGRRAFFGRVAVGLLIGVGAVAPGVSGGAIAVICGVYQRITEALMHWREDFKKQALFLLPLGIGGVLGVVLCGRVLGACFSDYPILTETVIWGLMAGTLPSVIHTAGQKGIRPWYSLLTVATMAAGLWLFFGNAGSLTGVSPFWRTMCCGAILAFGTVVPGVSSSFILLSMGQYEATLQIIGGQQPDGILPLALGFGSCALILLKLVDVCYKKWYGSMSFAVLGLLLSSMVPAFPPLSVCRESSFLLLLMLGCAVLSYLGMRRMTRVTSAV